MSAELRELVVCSLERWDEVWRRNQFLADRLLARRRTLRILFVEPPSDPLHDLARRRPPSPARMRRLRDDGRLHALRPLKPLPRRVGPFADRALERQVLAAAARLGFSSPLLWLNDVHHVALLTRTRWRSVYDVTDDWLLDDRGASPRQRSRLADLDARALLAADEVVVCSPALAATRGARRAVTLIPNAVDAEFFRAPRARPGDLPAAPLAVYVGTLHDARLDVELVDELARALPALAIALVGPVALSPASRARLRAQRNVHVLGARPHADVPAYLQHADVVIVPHRVTPFTESLDPIKAYECLAIATPTVATPVAGFREHEPAILIAPRERFPDAVAAVLRERGGRALAPCPGWDERAAAFEAVLERAAAAAWRGAS